MLRRLFPKLFEQAEKTEHSLDYFNSWVIWLEQNEDAIIIIAAALAISIVYSLKRKD